MAFCDVDENKIKQGVYVYEESKVQCTVSEKCTTFFVLLYHKYLILQAIPKPHVPIIHFTQARPPFILCVKWVSY